MLEVVLLIIILMARFGRDLSGLSYEWLDDKLVRFESRLGLIGWGVILSILLIAAASAYARLDINCAYLGRHYARLAENPFAFDGSNPVSFRILTPLISYFVGLHGKGIIVTNLFISALMILSVYVYGRRTLRRPGDAFLMAVIGAFSLVILTSIHCGGYCDILTYLIIFLMWWFRTKRLLFYSLFLAGLLNRESIAFLLPWFILISFDSNQKWYRCILEMLLGFSAALTAYYMVRLWIGSTGDIKYSLDYYLGPLLQNPLKNFRVTFYYHSLGLFSVFKLAWIIPCFAVRTWLRDGNYGRILEVFVILLCSYAQLFVAQDTSRMFTLSFMIMFISLDFLLKYKQGNFRQWVFWVVLLNLCIPQVYTAGLKVEVWQTLSSHLISKIL